MRWGITLAACLLLCGPVAAQGPAPQKQPLAFPIIVAPPGNAQAPSLDCVVSFGPAVPMSALAFSPDGKTLAVGGYQEVLLWDLANATLAKRIGVGQIGDFVRAVAFRNNGQWLAVAEGTPYGPGAVKVFDVNSGQPALVFAEPKTPCSPWPSARTGNCWPPEARITWPASGASTRTNSPAS